MSRLKSFNLFIFLSTFVRSLIEVFIPLILYEKGVSIEHIFLFLLMNFVGSFILNIPLGYLANKITFKWLTIISSIFIGISYYYLLLTDLNVLILAFISLTHVINAHTYWLTRHYYTLNTLPDENIGDEIGNIIIISQLSLIPASYIGALLMNKMQLEYFLIIVTVLYILSSIPLFKLKEEKQLKFSFYNVKQTLLKLPKRSFWFFIFAQFRIVSRYLFPLYIFINIERKFEYIGVFNIAVGIASMIFVYMFSRKIDRDRKDYLALSGVLSTLVWLLKLNVFTTLFMLVIGFLEGLVEKMYETSFNRNLYALGKHYDSSCYPLVVEGLQSFVRIIILLFICLFIKDLKIALYITAFMLMVAGIVGFDDGEGGY